RAWRVEDQVEYLRRVGAPYLAAGTPKVAQMLAIEAARQQQQLSIPTIFVSGGAADAEDRKTCAETFGSKLIGLYSSKEGGHIAHPCPERETYHIASERILVELVDDAGLPVPQGVSGR